MTEKKKDRETERVVLVKVMIQAEDLTDEHLAAIGGKRADGLVETWAPVLENAEGEVSTFRGKSKRAAIEAAIGKGDAAIPGEYRAPSVLSWKDGLRVVVPEKPLPLFESVD